MSKYRISQYNFTFKKGENYIIYNALKDSLVLVDQELYESIQNVDLELVPKNLISELLENGIIIPENFSELNYLRYQYRKALELPQKQSRISLMLITTYDCNLSCPYCYLGDIKRDKNRMSPENIDTIFQIWIDEVKKLDLTLYGGEPLLNWRACLYVIDKLRDMRNNNKHVSLRIVTNATLLSEEKLEILSKQPYPISIQVTLDGCRKLHNKKRFFSDKKGTFDIIVRNIKNTLKYKNIKPHIRINVDKTNYKSMKILLEELKIKRLEDVPIYFAPIFSQEIPVCEERSSDYYLVGKEIRDKISKLWEMSLGMGFKMKAIRPSRKNIPCAFPIETSFIIDPFMDIYSCWSTIGMKEFRIGKISEDGRFVPEPMYYETYSFDPTFVQECKECKFLPLCMGGCRWEAYKKFKKFNEGPGCPAQKFLFEKGLKLYIEKKYLNCKL